MLESDIHTILISIGIGVEFVGLVILAAINYGKIQRTINRVILGVVLLLSGFAFKLPIIILKILETQ